MSKIARNARMFSPNEMKGKRYMDQPLGAASWRNIRFGTTAVIAERWCGASADFLKACPPARHPGRRQHVALALGRYRQRLPGVQKIEEAIFQCAPFVFFK